jgi:hypothetical protein
VTAQPPRESADRQAGSRIARRGGNPEVAGARDVEHSSDLIYNINSL